MTIPVRRPRPTGRVTFSTRQTFLWFALTSALICGCGLMLKSLVKAAGMEGALAGIWLIGMFLVFLGLRGGRRRRARRLPAEPAPDPAQPIEAPYDFAGMDPDTFEHAIATLCERDGCTEVQVVGGAGDLGADVLGIAPDGRRIVIQCKRYGPVNKVGSQDMQRFGGTCFAVHDAQIAAVVTTGEFTGPAEEYAEQCGILCLDQSALTAWAEGTSCPPWAANSPH
ncbi:restriction endonuclease [Streptomyces sp. NPDC059828]|uniref:restriction endonuclease n=1 Tax=Streptomyces sp. NPDC059828 TaxID=3346965 RepID=UPI00364AB163